ncbi:autotransporter outer membrane beta-barrel domain-containing protein [Variovorax sp. J2P1-59]|uniref:autotransporter outer membrane beta-barrel domain-containing protein n=1 Tax=Variovorax flavidus TaxID=3053501 RepID=UPI0025750097|nr:autotransporter outer membrane beta-barrel domain-containing protein [Variovorax sp. J2P1-59]MDM0074340.1 autotransporter outer membrane beta-barrel domain-containing protein [Variovorax sp. J2P1-59]
MNRVFSIVWNPSQRAWTVASELAANAGKSSTRVRSGTAQVAVAAALLGLAGIASAACSTSANVITCNTTGTATDTAGRGDSTPAGASVIVQPAAVISSGGLPGISVGTNSTILIQAGATVKNNAPGSTNGYFGTGANTIEFRSGSTLTIEKDAKVLSTGSASNAEAINPIGTGNRIVNNGEIRSQAGGAAIWFESSSGSNTIENGATGIIEYKNGAGNIMGVSGTMALDFTNKGQLIGSLNFANGDDALRIYTGSSISGSINGGGGVNLLTLNGTGTGVVSQTISNFQTLVKNDSGTWTFNKSLAGVGITSTRVAGGTLILGSDASGYTGSMTVDAAGTLQTSAVFMPKTITDHGVVRFEQLLVDATYTGLLTGTGGIEKTGDRMLTLTTDQAITGTTTITAGVLRLGNGGTAGKVDGPIVNNAALTIHRRDGVAFANPISGTGSVTQLGTGTTLFTADNTYSGGTTITAGTLQLGDGGATGSVVGNIVNNAMLVVNRSNTLTLAGAISGSGALRQTGSGTTVLSGTNSYGGTTTVAAGTLEAGAAGSFSALSAHTVATGATLDTAGFNQTVASLQNAGTVSLLSKAAGSTLTVNGAYAGHNGVLSLGTVLGGNASLSDRLVLNGPGASASGRTTVRITNLGGLGAQTTGNGIEVVSARNGATTTAQTTRDAFTLANGHVDAGAFEYRLHAADAQGAGESWYLRSETTIPPQDLSVKPVPPATSDASGAAPPTAAVTTVPTYRAEVPLFAALPAQLRQADLAMLGNLHRRVGDEGPAVGGRQAWARAIYSDLDIHQDGIASAQSKGHVSGLQAGTDLLAGGNWRAGIYVGYLDGSADVSGNARGAVGRVGYNDLQSRYLAGYATWMDASGLYADAVLQGGSHRYTVRPDGNPSASGKSNSTTASIETGKAFALAEGWSIEPQAQLAYQRSSFDDVLIGGARVQQDADGGWIGRLGVRIKGDIATRAGRLEPYGRFNVYYAGSGTDVATFVGPAASTRIASATGHTSTEVAAGMTLALTRVVTLYGELGRLFNAGGEVKVKSSVQGSLGMRVSW